MRKIEFSEFLRSAKVSKNKVHTFLFGAGCSISSGIQSAENCIWEWKKEIFESENPEIREWINNHKDPQIQKHIQGWLDKKGKYVESGSNNEYSFYAEKCYSDEESRRRYFEKICSGISPSIGYQAIPVLVSQGILQQVWTTNFDDLISDACACTKVTSRTISPESRDRTDTVTPEKGKLNIFKLHGDFRYSKLSNTTNELVKLDSKLRRKLIHYVQDNDLIVIGYSGRDDSIMKALREAYSKKAGGRLYWCGQNAEPSPKIKKLLESGSKNREMFYVLIDDFDTALLNFAKFVAGKEEKKKLIEIQQKNRVEPTPFKLDTTQRKKEILLKSNCFKINLPEKILVCKLKPHEKIWDIIKKINRDNRDVTAACHGEKIWALGNVEAIEYALGDISDGKFKSQALIDAHDPHIKYLILSTLCKSIAIEHECHMDSDYINKIWNRKSKKIGEHEIHEAVSLHLEFLKENCYLSLSPSYHVKNGEERIKNKLFLGREFYSKLWNAKFNNYIKDWVGHLAGKYILSNFGKGFDLNIGRTPIFTAIHTQDQFFPNLSFTGKKFLELEGVKLEEPSLLFSSKENNRQVFDTHPLRGLLNNRPFSSPIDSCFGDINLSVISPRLDKQDVYNFIRKQLSKIRKDAGNESYLVDFGGFYEIYGVQLNVPNPDGTSWEYIDEPTGAETNENARNLKEKIFSAIKRIASVGSNSIAVIYIPQRWDSYTKYYGLDNMKSFDLHDEIKAFCVREKIMTQIIREKTIKNISQQCHTNWGLSLAYYAKSSRTPWAIKNIDETAAFAGIGYSIEREKDIDNHITLGCSHIYNSAGEGLRCRLSKINKEDIQWKKKSPHLCYEDAYKFGHSIMNLFYKSIFRFPKRVVVHKRTFFSKEEVSGIVDSMQSNHQIESIDLVEINFENHIKYLSSRKSKNHNKELEIDNYPVSRGTCILLNSKRALLWTHGSVPSIVNSQLRSYLGGKYIPRPLKITKHYGMGRLEQIAQEILGLTKMNWNTPEYYSSLPVTILSSNEIARVGKLINPDYLLEDYDFRYFI